jgi:hypothetical protein
MTAVTSVSAAPAPLPADLGRFAWDVAARKVVWSDSVYHLHGYRPGQILPSPSLALAHKHREDLPECVDALHAGMLSDRLIVHEHRVVDTHGRVRPVVMVARSARTEEGQVRSLQGFLLSTSVQLERSTHPVSDWATRSVVPVIMTAFGISEPAARVVLGCRRPLTARRSPEERAAVEWYDGAQTCGDLRRTIEDGMFPLNHLSFKLVALAA